MQRVNYQVCSFFIDFQNILSNGKRKSSAKPPPKKWNDKLNIVFNYLFCSHDTSVECRIDMKNLIGKASCRICEENFSTTITALLKFQQYTQKQQEISSQILKNYSIKPPVHNLQTTKLS
ncbi:transcription elongation factor 1-like protein [Pyrus ussuriensis x Pyrus communis]|uniref:Transcription elongation factor 1 homolog n=1 Tax=Pyrus ussuriensis x Pyrus communis TaxID=2448454 RepID=A0A5N5HSS3_9ROSA|nr:transcription elongation factor 1-like protein [Pyrus ussuriensis x Pyrus communis]